MATNNKKKQIVISKSMGDMPHSLEAEQALLGCLLMSSQLQVEMMGMIKEEDFFAESHRCIFSTITEIVKSNRTADFVTLIDALEKKAMLDQAGGFDYLLEISSSVPSASNYVNYLEIIQRDSLLRKLINGSAEIIEDAKKSTDKNLSLANAEKIMYEISNTEDTSEMVKIGGVLPSVMNRLDELSKNKADIMGIRTKFKGIDNILNGLHKSDLMILAARPAVGKTSFAMNIVESIALQGYSCAVFSLEMSKEQLVQRLLCSVAGVSMNNVSRGQMNKKEWLKIMKASNMLKDAKIHIDDSSMITPEQVLSKCRRLKRREGLDFIMIDYIQLMSPGSKRKNENRQTEITEISRNLKILAKEINVPVLALSQLSRDVEKNKRRPQLSDLRESGAIEQDADIVMFIHRPDLGATEKELSEGKIAQNVAEILIAKHRNGETGLVKLYFKGECTKFLNLNPQTNEVEDTTIDEETKARPVDLEGVESLDIEKLKEGIGGNQDEESIDDQLYGN